MGRYRCTLLLLASLAPWVSSAAQAPAQPTFSDPQRITLRFEERYQIYERAYRNARRIDPMRVRADSPSPAAHPEQAAIQVVAAQAQGAVGAYEALLDKSALQVFRDRVTGDDAAARQAAAWTKEFAGREIALTRRVDRGHGMQIVELAVLEAGSDSPVGFKRLAFALQGKGWKHVFLDDDPVYMHFGFPEKTKVVETP